MEFGKKAEPTSSGSVGDVSVNMNDTGLLKAYIPEFLYKPPFGYPRKENIPLIRQLAKNPYVFSVIKTLADEAASTDWDVVYKEEAEPSEALDKIIKEIKYFFDNPNNNKESFQQILRTVVKDIAEIDSGIIIKAFNQAGQFTQIFARDGGSFLKNPDIYGYIGDREEIIEPISVNFAVTPESPDWTARLHQYGLAYSQSAAYFQYGTTAVSLPVPFGRREVIYMMQNPRSDNIYGISAIQILADIITTLVFGSHYNLDFYMNNNMPEGVIQVLGADQDQITAFRQRFDAQFRKKDETTGFMRKTGFKFPIINQEAKFTPFQLDPQVMQIIEQQSWFTKIVWACFGVTADEMGFTENSNKAVSQTQTAVFKRKAVRPMLNLIKYHIDKEIIAEWGQEAFENLEFKWNDYDLEEDIKKHQLYESQIRMGIKTAEMIAEEEGIDVEQLKAGKEEERQRRMEEQVLSGMPNFNDSQKALTIVKDTRVKVVNGSGPHSGKTGIVENVRSNGEEQYYIVRFRDGMDIFFSQELKVVDGGIPEIIDEEPIEDVEEKACAAHKKPKDADEKSMKFDNDLEKELVTVVKSRGKELLKALEQYKNGELDKVM